MDAQLLEHITVVSELARAHGFADVAAWMQQQAAHVIEQDRRRRGNHGMLDRTNHGIGQGKQQQAEDSA